MLKLGPQLVALFWEMTETLGGGASLAEVGHWSMTWKQPLSLASDALPCYGPRTDGAGDCQDHMHVSLPPA